MWFESNAVKFGKWKIYRLARILRVLEFRRAKDRFRGEEAIQPAREFLGPELLGKFLRKLNRYKGLRYACGRFVVG